MPNIKWSVNIGARALGKFDTLKSFKGKRLKTAGIDAVVECVRNHLMAYAQTHHKSAQRLGAKPTGHLVKAANSIKRTSGGFTITSAGIRRAFHSLNIRAKNAPYLTIPINKISYGKWFRQLPAAIKAKAFRPQGCDIIAYTKRKKLVPLYALKKSVVVPRERRLLPTDATIRRVYKQAFKKAFSNNAR